MRKKTHLLLQAADIVAAADPCQFCMSNLNGCSIYHITREPDFKKLKDSVYGNDGWKQATAHFFGIGMKDVDLLFGGHKDYNPAQAARKLREVALRPPRKRKPKSVTGMQVIEKAIAEVEKTPSPPDSRTYRVPSVRISFPILRPPRRN